MIWSTLLLAFREIRRNVLRSTLTGLGIIIGVGAVIAMVTVGSGTTARVTGDIAALGTNLLTITPGTQVGRGPGGTRSVAPAFDLADAEAIAERVIGVAAVAPAATAIVQAVYGNNNWPTSVTGTDNEYFVVRDRPLIAGQTFTENELRAGKAVCVLGTTVRDELFGRQDPLGRSIRLGKVSCEVIGVLESKGQAMGGVDQDDTVIMPIRAVQRRLAGNLDVNSISVSAQSSELTATVKSGIEAVLRERRRVSAGEQNDFNVRDITELASALASTTQVLTVFLGALAAVSLVVGGIGIMNIMLVSVTERTREIGIRLAIGALERDVLAQFLVEAIVLASLGGLIGVVVGLVGAWLGAPMVGVPFVLNPYVIVVAFGFSGIVGVAFGYFPAQKAARLDPIDALRHE